MPVDAPEDLYGLPLERFIAERTALAKSLRAEKRREAADEVAALRKPSVAAWAVNQLVRTQPQTLRSLCDAGDALAQAQRQAASGEHSGGAMREATRRRREALGELTEAAEGLLSSQGNALSQATLDRVTDTLRAAAIDEAARRKVQSGCLTHELQFAGLGLSGLPTPSAPQQPARRSDRKTPAPGKAAAAKTERRRRADLGAARKAEDQARRAAARAEKELTAAQARREEAAAQLEKAKRHLTQAEELLSAAERRSAQTAAELESAEQTVRDVAEP